MGGLKNETEKRRLEDRRYSFCLHPIKE